MIRLLGTLDSLPVCAGCQWLAGAGVTRRRRRRAAAEVFADLCAGDIDVEASAAGEAIAEAWATAALSWIVDCISGGNAFACALVEADVRARALAFADSFSSAFADTGPGCPCEINVETAAEVITDVIVRATLSVNREFCVEGAPTALLYSCRCPRGHSFVDSCGSVLCSCRWAAADAPAALVLSVCLLAGSCVAVQQCCNCADSALTTRSNS